MYVQMLQQAIAVTPRIFKSLLVVIFLFGHNLAAAEVHQIKVATSRYHSSKYLQATNSEPCYQQSPTAFVSQYRGAVEINLLCHLFHAAGYQVHFTFVPSFDYNHAISLLKSGEVDLLGETTWSNSVEKAVMLSNAVYRKHEYWLGLYTLPEKVEQIQIASLDDLKGLVGVSNEYWNNDWSLLQAMPLKATISKRTAFEMFSFVKRGYADFVLWPFSFMEADFGYTLTPIENYPKGHFRLLPVRNIKVTAPFSRHYVVSNPANSSKKIIERLNQGISKFREQGLIRKFYLQSGYFNQEVANWPRLELDVD